MSSVHPVIQVKKMIQKFADQALKAMGAHDEISVTSSYKDVVGIYFAINVTTKNNENTINPGQKGPALAANDLFPVAIVSADSVFFNTKSGNNSLLSQHQFIKKLM